MSDEAGGVDGVACACEDERKSDEDAGLGLMGGTDYISITPDFL